MLANLTNIIGLPYMGLTNQIQETVIHEIYYYSSSFLIESINQI